MMSQLLSDPRPGGEDQSESVVTTAPNVPSLAIAGLSRLSTCDWPGKLVATVFCQGCPWSCTYCHNPDLLNPRTPGVLEWSDIRNFLATRVGLLDGVVFSGGEATRQNLVAAVADVRALGLGVGLHSSGAYPRRLGELLPLVDWVGFDVKAHPDRYVEITQTHGSWGRVRESLDLLLASGVNYQVRTTWGPGVMSRNEAEGILRWLEGVGVREPVLQDVRPDGARAGFIERYRREASSTLR